MNLCLEEDEKKGNYQQLLLTIFYALTFIIEIAQSFSASSISLQEQNQGSTIAPSTRVLEGNCVVVCDENKFTARQNEDTYWSGSRRSNKIIAFTAIRNDSPLEMNGTVITFDYTEVNKGNAYNRPQTNAFTAPVNGIYMFEFVVFKRLNKSALKIALTVS